MSVLVTGGTGIVGRFVVEALLASEIPVIVAGRSPPSPDLFSRRVEFRPLNLDPGGFDPGIVEGADHLVHAAFHHVPGRYRGGEGDAPDAFRRINLDGTIALFDAARHAGLCRCVFLSSRAVYGRQPAGATLDEGTKPYPDTLYGRVKHQAENRLLAIASSSFLPIVLRVTGVYGPPPGNHMHKWSHLFADFLSGREIESRCGTEVHGSDVAGAVVRMLTQTPSSRGVYNLSDLVVDRRDLLGIVADETGCRNALPDRAETSSLNVMSSDRLKVLGWQPGGIALFDETVRRLARAALANLET